MNRKEVASLGGVARAEIQRQEAAERKAEYDKNPNHCLQCRKPILSSPNRKLRETMVKKFCDQSCGAVYNNAKKPKREKIAKPKIEKIIEIETLTKGELFEKRNGYQSARGSIQRHARQVYQANQEKLKCFVCEYNKHVQISHIRPVSDFPEDALITTINALDNLISLCPNHHWEFDNDELVIEGIIKEYTPKLTATDLYNSEPGRCHNCSNPIYAKEGRSVAAAKRTRYCSIKCFADHRSELGIGTRQPIDDTAEQIIADVEKFGWSESGRKRGITDNGLRKRAKTLGLDPKQISKLPS